MLTGILADLGDGGYAPQNARTPGCHSDICVSILGHFGVSAQIGPLQLYSLDHSASDWKY